MLMSVCASSQDSEGTLSLSRYMPVIMHCNFQVHSPGCFCVGAFQILQLVQEAALNADCKLYTTLISTCAKSGKVDTMFKVH